MKIIRVALGVLYNQVGEILITKRQDHQFMGGFWELPGGKIKTNESAEVAITRELKEELGIEIDALSLHQTMVYDYADRTVSLRIYTIGQFKNTPFGQEGQKIAWAAVKDLCNYQLLPTMKGFISSITLPNQYWITPPLNQQNVRWVDKFEQKLAQGIRLIQLRSKIKLDNLFIQELSNKCQQNNVKLLLNTSNKTFNEAHGDGWHITTNELLKLAARPCTQNKLLGVSTHNLEQALKAQAIGADFVVISPICATPTHPDTVPLGWAAGKQVVDTLNIPVYFLGGMGLNNLDKALRFGAQGIAGVSAF